MKNKKRFRPKQGSAAYEAKAAKFAAKARDSPSERAARASALPPGAVVCFPPDRTVDRDEADAKHLELHRYLPGSLAAWTTATVREFEIDRPEAAGGSEAPLSIRYRLQYEDGSERLVSLMVEPFSVMPSAELAKLTWPRAMLAHLGLTGARRAAASAPSRELGDSWQQREWLSKVKGEPLNAVAELVAEVVLSMDAMNLSASLSRFAREYRGNTGVAPAVSVAVGKCVECIAADGIESYSARSLANICWALAKLEVVSVPGTGVSGAAKPGATGGLAGALQPSVTKAAAVLMVAVVERFLRDMQVAAKAEFEWEQNGSLWGDWACVEVSNLCWAVGRCLPAPPGSPAQRLLSVVAQGALLSKWFGFSAQEMANTFSAIASAGYAPPLLMERTCAKLRKHPEMFKPQEVCLVLLAAARARAERNVIADVLRDLLPKIAEDGLTGYNAVDLSNLTWVLAARVMRGDDYLAEQELLATCAGFILKTCQNARESGQWDASELMGLVYSLSKLRVLDVALLRSVCERWSAWLDAAEEGIGGRPPATALLPTSLSSLALTMARLGYLDAALLARLCDRLRSALREGGAAAGPWRPQNIANLIWGAACSLSLAAEKAAKATADAEARWQAAEELASALQKLMIRVCKQIQSGALGLSRGVHLSMLHIANCTLRAWAVCQRQRGCDGKAWEAPPEMAEAWKHASVRHMGGAAEQEAMTSIFHKAVASVLREHLVPRMFPAGARQRNEVDLDGFVVDIFLEPADGGRPVAIEADGRSHFLHVLPGEPPEDWQITDKMILDGRSRQKMWTVRNLKGVATASVPSYRWMSLEPEERTDFLQKILERALND